MEQDETGDGGI